jgi:hypothetical protein
VKEDRMDRGGSGITTSQYYEQVGDSLGGEEAERAYRKAQNELEPHKLEYMESLRRLSCKIIAVLEQQ